MLPQISLNDGHHKMILAKEGERVLTQKQNAEYEEEHPDARQKPMTARVMDCGGIIGGTDTSVYD